VNFIHRVKGMFKRKGMVVVGCIIILLLIFLIGWVEEKMEIESSCDDSVTFCDLIMDFDTSTFKFASYEPGDNITVKDKISKMEIRENMSIDHNGKEYGYSANIWLDSMKELIEYYEKPTLSLIGDHNKTTMLSDFQVGDDITFHFSLRNLKPESSNLNPMESEGLSRSSSEGFKVFVVNCTINDDRSEVEVIKIKVGLLGGSPETSIHDSILEITYGDDEYLRRMRIDNTLLHYNNTAFLHEILVLKEVENFPDVYIWDTIFDHMEKPKPAKVDLFRYEILRDIEDYSLSEGIMTGGDVIKILFNFSQFHEPPSGKYLDPGSFIQIKIIPRHGIPTLEGIQLPDVFPEDEKWIQL